MNCEMLAHTETPNAGCPRSSRCETRRTGGLEGTLWASPLYCWDAVSDETVTVFDHRTTEFRRFIARVFVTYSVQL